MKAIDHGTIDYKNELLRKSIHLCSLSIPIIYSTIDKELALQILIPITVVSVLVDFGRHIFPPLNKIFTRFFGFLLREHEKDSKKKNLSGAAYVFLGSLITILFFPKIFAIISIAVLIVGDIGAALIGRKYGKHKFFFKSLEGTLSFFFIGCLVVIFTPLILDIPFSYPIGFIAIAVGALAENLSFGWADDNLTIPISISLTMWLLYIIFLPDIVL